MLGSRLRKLFCVGWLMASSVAAQTRAEPAMDARPNVLVILTDDQTFRSVAALGHDGIHTPNIDRLVARGTTFTHAFNQGSWSAAVCVPSRAMLHSGRHLFQIVTPHHFEAASQLVGVEPLWAEQFRLHGYRTFGTGKWHNGRASFHRSFSDGGHIYFGGMHDPKSGGHFRAYLSDYDPEGLYDKSRVVEGYSTDLFAEAALDFLDRHGPDQSHPFFLYLAFTAPHDPRHAPDQWLERYDAAQITLPPNVLPEHPFDQGHHRIRDETLLPFPRERDAVRRERAIYYAMITHLDARIGDIMARLEQQGRLDQTLIVFTSDHGLAVGEHGLLGKQNQYDHSVRVPLILAGPGVPAGARRSDLVYVHQLFATTCELAGLPVPKTVQASSLVPILRGTGKGHETVFGAYLDFQRMVRDARYKLIRYPQVERVQLFDLESDPWEMKDLSDEEASRPIIARLDRALRAWQERLHDPLLNEQR